MADSLSVRYDDMQCCIYQVASSGVVATARTLLEERGRKVRDWWALKRSNWRAGETAWKMETGESLDYWACDNDG